LRIYNYYVNVNASNMKLIFEKKLNLCKNTYFSKHLVIFIECMSTSHTLLISMNAKAK
jgi:hypothetical protein